MNQVKRILVTGGAGYIGSHTVVALAEQGFVPVIVDNFSNSHSSVLQGIDAIVGKKIEFRQVDAASREGLKVVFDEFSFDGIIHFAAFKAVGESVQKPLKYYRNNLDTLANCLDLAEEFQVPNFVFSSSCTVYGELQPGQRIVTELTSQAPALSPYATTKKLGEQMITDFVAAGAKLRVLNLRYFNPVGAHPTALIGELPLGKPNNLLPVVTQTAIGKLEAVVVHGNDYDTPDGTCVRDYVHVSDVAEAHVKGLEWLGGQLEGTNEVLNIGRGEGASVLEIIHIFEEISGQNLNWSFGPRRSGDIAEIFADVAKAKQVLGWQAKRTVKDAVIDAWNWEQRLNHE